MHENVKSACTYSPFPFLFFANAAYSQAANGGGVSYGFNSPFSGQYQAGHGYNLIGSIALKDRFALMPYVGIERIESSRKVVYSPNDYPYYNYRTLESADIIHVGVDARYYFNKYLFTKGGLQAYIASGNEDIINAGIGASGSLGISIPITSHIRLEGWGYTDVIYLQRPAGAGIVPFGGVRGGLFFYFGKPLLNL